MLSAVCLDCIEEGTEYSETAVCKYQQHRATLRKSEGLNIQEFTNCKASSLDAKRRKTN
jgi:hypothetical protein